MCSPPPLLDEPTAPDDLHAECRHREQVLTDALGEAERDRVARHKGTPDDLSGQPCNRFLDAAEALMQQVAAYSATQTGTADHGMIHAAGRLRVVLNSYRHDYVADPGAPRPCGCHPAVPEPTAPDDDDDLQEQVAEAIRPLALYGRETRMAVAAAVMDVLRRNGMVP